MICNFLKGPPISLMNVKSNGIAISSRNANIAVVNQFLLTLRTIIVDVGAFRLHATSSHIIFFLDQVVSRHFHPRPHGVHGNQRGHKLQSHWLCCALHTTFWVGHVHVHYNLNLQWLQAMDVLLLLQLTNRQGIGRHRIPTCFIWVTVVSNMQTIALPTLQLSNTLSIDNFYENIVLNVCCLDKHPYMTIASIIHTCQQGCGHMLH